MRKITVYRATLYDGDRLLRLPFTRVTLERLKDLKIMRRDFKQMYGANKVYFSFKQI